MTTGGRTKTKPATKMRRTNNRHQATPGSIAMDFVEGVVDLGAPEINVTGVASIERISNGQMRITYYVRRRGEAVAAVHHIWDRQEWLKAWRVWDSARQNITGGEFEHDDAERRRGSH